VTGQQHTVGGHREVAERLGREHRHQRGHVTPQQRLAAGEPHLVHAEIHEDVDERRYLLERQQVTPRQPGVLRFRHAVPAPQVAPVGDGDPQVAERAAVGVEHQSRVVTFGHQPNL
jgi:hypothetical protein